MANEEKQWTCQGDKSKNPFVEKIETKNGTNEIETKKIKTKKIETETSETDTTKIETIKTKTKSFETKATKIETETKNDAFHVNTCS